MNAVGSQVQLIVKTLVQHFLSISDEGLDLSGKKTQVRMLLVGGVDGESKGSGRRVAFFSKWKKEVSFFLVVKLWKKNKEREEVAVKTEM